MRPEREPPWVYDDGGRAAAGYRGSTGDCTCRGLRCGYLAGVRNAR